MRKVTMSVAALMFGVGVIGISAAMAESVREAKKTVVSFRPATDRETAGYERVTLDDNQVIYVSPNTPLTNSDVISSAVTPTGALDMVVSKEAIGRLAGILDSRLAIFVDGRIVTAPTVATKGAEGTLVLAGMLPGQVQRVARILNQAPISSVGPTLTAVASKTGIKVGEEVNIDVFITGVTNLRAYQVALDTFGGSAGRLEVTNLRVDTARPDFIFGSNQAVSTVDRNNGRLVAALYSGGVNAFDQPAYLGSFTLLASAEARGEFGAQIRIESDTMLRTPASEAILFQPGPAAKITVGLGEVNLRPTK